VTLDDLVHKQLVATAELACAAVAAGLRDTMMFYQPGDAPYVTRWALSKQLQICTDGGGTFDVWQITPQRIIKVGISLGDAVAVLGGTGRHQ